MGSKVFLWFIIAAFLWNFSGPELSGLDLEDYISPEYAAALRAGEKPVLAQFKDPRPELMPRNELLKGLVEGIQKNLDPSVMVEYLFMYPKPRNAEKGGWSAGEEAELYNNVLALSTLEGIQYYSASREAIRTFYESSFVIDGPSGKKPLPDPSYPWPQAELTVYARQKDLTFGENTYQYDYYTALGTIVFIQRNLSSLTYGIIPAVGKNKLYSAVAVLDGGEQLLVYMASMSKTASVPGMKDRIGSSFANRAEAIFNWFSNQADKAFK